jgi:hypothetical protein
MSRNTSGGSFIADVLGKVLALLILTAIGAGWWLYTSRPADREIYTLVAAIEHNKSGSHATWYICENTDTIEYFYCDQNLERVQKSLGKAPSGMRLVAASSHLNAWGSWIETYYCIDVELRTTFVCTLGTTPQKLQPIIHPAEWELIAAFAYDPFFDPEVDYLVFSDIKNGGYLRVKLGNPMVNPEPLVVPSNSILTAVSNSSYSSEDMILYGKNGDGHWGVLK